MKPFNIFALGSLVLFSLPLAPREASGAEVRSGERVHVAADATIDEDLYAGAREVVIDGVVRGDLIAAGSTVTVHGRVDGSVMAAGGKVTIDGRIGKAARLAGGEVRVQGEVGSDVLAACGTCALGGAGKVGADLIVAGGDLDLAGAVGQGIWAAGEKVRLAGASGAEARVRAGSLKLNALAAAPSLVYGARDAVSIPEGVRIARIERRADWAPAEPNRFGGALLLALMALVTGAVLLWLLPARATAAAKLLERRPGASLLWGLALALATPLLIVTSAVTVLALPLSMLGAAVYLFALYFGYLTSASFLGGLALRRARTARPFAAFALGVAALGLMGLIPVLGPMVRALATLAGLGCLGLSLSDSRWFTARFRRKGAGAAEAHGMPPVTRAD